MRDFEFRAFDKATKKMSPQFTLFGEFMLLGTIHEWQYEEGNRSQSSLEALNDLIIMQYTDRRAKNGDMIFEGDIVKSHGLKQVGVIKFNHPYCCGFIVRYFEDFNGQPINVEDDSSIAWHTLTDTEKDFEIIGDIYTTPELAGRYGYQ